MGVHDCQCMYPLSIGSAHNDAKKDSQRICKVNPCLAPHPSVSRPPLLPHTHRYTHARANTKGRGS